MLDFKYITNLKDYAQAVLDLKDCFRLAVDCETYTSKEFEKAGLDAQNLRNNPHTGDVSLVMVASEKLGIYIFDIIHLLALNFDASLLGDLLRSKKYLIAHNAKYEASMLSRQFGWINNWECTFVLAALYGNATGSKIWRVRGLKLGDLCRDWLGITLEGKGSSQITQWYSDPSSRTLENESWMIKLKYGAGDVAYLFKLRDILSQIVRSPLPSTPLIAAEIVQDYPKTFGLGMDKTARVELYLSSLAAKLEVTGIPYKSLVEKKFIQAVAKKHIELGEQICESLGLELIADGLYGDLVPSPGSLIVLNNPKKLCNLLSSKTSLNFTNVQSSLLRRAIDVLSELSRAEADGDEVNLEFIEGEADVFGDLESLSLDVKLAGFNILSQIIEHKRYGKQLSMMLGSFVNPKDRRIHSRFDFSRAATGRVASAKPNVQQVSARLEVTAEFTLEELASLVDIV